MNSCISYFAQRSFLARIMTVMVLFIGAASLSTLNLQEYPDVAFEELEITTVYPGATAQDIEINITNLIEKELKSVEGIKLFTSQSSDGLSAINVELTPSNNMNKVLRDVQQAVDRVSGLPKDITNPPMVAQPGTSSLEVLTFGISSVREQHKVNETALQNYARKLEKQLKGISGVGTISMTGYNEREFWIEIDPTKISRYKLTFNEVISAVNNRSLSLSGGVVESWNSEQKIVTMTQVQSTDELSQTIIKVLPTGALIRLGDIATIIDTFENSTQKGMINGKDAILFSITNSASADIITTIDNIKALLKKEGSAFEGQFAFDYGLNLADDMSEKFSIVSTNGMIGLILVLAVLSLILKRQIAFWVSMSIPFCILGVIAILPMLGMNLDSITLAALLLVIGVIVDDSVIVAESIYQEKEKGLSALDAAVSGTQKVIKPIIASLTTTALVFIPMLFIPGTMGKAIFVIPVTVIAALLFSLAECTFTLPAHLANSLDKKERKEEKVDKFQIIINQYQRLLTHSLNYKKSVLIIAVVSLIGSAWLVTNLKLDIFPSEAAKYIEIYTEVKPGTPIEKIRAAHATLEEIITALPDNELKSVEITYSSPISTGLIALTSFENRDRTADEIITELDSKLTSIDTLSFVKLSVDAGGPPPGEPVELRVLGGTSAERNATVQLVMTWLKEQSGLNKITNNEELKDPQLQIIPQYEWLARYNLTTADLASTLRIAFEGESVTSTWLGDQEINIRVIMDEDYRSIEKLKTTKIYTANGAQVPLSRLAKVENIDAPRLIQHYNGDREVTVTAQIIDEALSSVALSETLLAELQGKYPKNVIIQAGGEAESTNETMSGFMIAFPAGLLGIYFVLSIMFNSLLQPLLVMTVIPFAVISALMALFIHSQALSLFALIGVLGMTGVVVNNSLVLINKINELMTEGFSTIEAVTQAASSRFRPILLTSITTVVGLLPLAYGLGGTDVFMGPMSLTLGYGLLFSLPVVLMVIPCMYLIFFNRKQNK